MKKHISLLASRLCLGTTALANSPYISEVYDFMPAPGQFTNTIPEYENGDTQASMNAKCKEYLAGQARGSMVCLGAYGGYIVFGFDHAVANKPGEYDLKIYGNAFAASGRDDGGSAEPGIVMVSYDANGNGIPDDAWYELAGSDYSKSTTFHNYEITYYKPSGTEPDSTYIRWTSNDPADPMGYVERNQFHRQDYWPGWAEGNTLTFRGTRLGHNAIREEGGNWFLRFLDWGYVDNRPNGEDPGFKLDWVVDAQGNPVHLDKVHFIKVHTGVNQTCGWLGETSTEIIGAEDLHPEYAGISGIESGNTLRLLGVTAGQLQLDNGTDVPLSADLYDLQGRHVRTLAIQPGYATYDLNGLTPGAYLLRAAGQTFKILV